MSDIQRVHVMTATNTPATHLGATKWHVDEFGRLHIRHKDGGNLATYHPNGWSAVWVEASD